MLTLTPSSQSHSLACSQVPHIATAFPCQKNNLPHHYFLLRSPLISQHTRVLKQEARQPPKSRLSISLCSFPFLSCPSLSSSPAIPKPFTTEMRLPSTQILNPPSKGPSDPPAHMPARTMRTQTHRSTPSLFSFLPGQEIARWVLYFSIEKKIYLNDIRSREA